MSPACCACCCGAVLTEESGSGPTLWFGPALDPSGAPPAGAAACEWTGWGWPPALILARRSSRQSRAHSIAGELGPIEPGQLAVA